MGLGLKSCVAVYLIELVRILLQYKWGTIFRGEWFWRMEQLSKRNGKGVWTREVEKGLKRFGSSLEWLSERIDIRNNEIERIRLDNGIQEGEKHQMLRAKRMNSISEVLEEVEVLIDTHIFNEFSETKSSGFLKKVISNQNTIDVRIFTKTWRSLNCTPRP